MLLPEISNAPQWSPPQIPKTPPAMMGPSGWQNWFPCMLTRFTKRPTQSCLQWRNWHLQLWKVIRIPRLLSWSPLRTTATTEIKSSRVVLHWRQDSEQRTHEVFEKAIYWPVFLQNTQRGCHRWVESRMSWTSWNLQICMYIGVFVPLKPTAWQNDDAMSVAGQEQLWLFKREKEAQDTNSTLPNGYEQGQKYVTDSGKTRKLKLQIRLFPITICKSKPPKKERQEEAQNTDSTLINGDEQEQKWATNNKNREGSLIFRLDYNWQWWARASCQK